MMWIAMTLGILFLALLGFFVYAGIAGRELEDDDLEDFED